MPITLAFKLVSKPNIPLKENNHESFMKFRQNAAIQIIKSLFL